MKSELPVAGVAASDAATAAQSRFLGRLTPEAKAAVIARGRVRPFVAGSTLFRQDDPAAQLHLLLSGKLKIWKVAASGAPLTIAYLSRGQVAGCVAVFCGTPLPASGTVTEAARIMCWGAATIGSLLAEYPQLKSNALAIVGGRTAEMLQRVEELSTEPAGARVARALLRETQRGDDATVAKLSRQDLAELTGTTLHTVSRLVSGWERQGWVRGGRQRVTVLDATSLAAATSRENKSPAV